MDADDETEVDEAKSVALEYLIAIHRIHLRCSQ